MYARTVSLIMGCACIGLIAWWLLFWIFQGQPPLTLSFPPDKHLRVALDLNGVFDELEPLGKSHQGKGSAHVLLVGTPTPLSGGTLYSFRIDELTIGPGEGNALFHFERVRGGNLVYRVDPDLSPPERQKVYDLFQIDIHRQSASDDRSLLTHSISLLISPTGQLLELNISHPMRNMLFSLLGSYRFGMLVERLITYPNRLPALLDRSSGSHWTTTGLLPVPIVCLHHLVDEGERLIIQSQGRLDQSRSDPEWLSPSIHVRQVTWNMSTALEAETRLPERVEGDVSVSLAGEYLGNGISRDYGVSFKALCFFVEPTLEVEQSVAPL